MENLDVLVRNSLWTKVVDFDNYAAVLVPSWIAQIVLLPAMASERYLLVCWVDRRSFYNRKLRIVVYAVLTAVIISAVIFYQVLFVAVALPDQLYSK